MPSIHDRMIIYWVVKGLKTSEKGCIKYFEYVSLELSKFCPPSLFHSFYRFFFFKSMYFETPFFVFVFACCLNIIVMVNNHISQLGITENKSMSPVPMTKDSFNWSPRHLCITLLFSSFHYLIFGQHCIDAPKHCDDRIYIMLSDSSLFSVLFKAWTTCWDL